MQAFLTLATLACNMCIAWLMEQPAEPGLEQAASIWHVREMQELYARGVRRELVLQGLYGAESAKPTHFATYCLSAFPEALIRWRNARAGPRKWSKLIGRCDDGSWRTASAKAYPWRLNMCIAESFFQRAIQMHARLNGPCTDSDELAEVYGVVTAAARAGVCMGPDYAQ